MAESALSLLWPDHRRLIGTELGYGPIPDDYNDYQNQTVDDCIVRGFARFYNPPPIDQSGVSHQWRFLKPLVDLSTVASQWEYDLPAEFGGLVGEVTFVTDSTTYVSIKQTSDVNIRNMRQTQTATTGQPCWVATRWLTTDGTTGQKQQLLFHPTPDAVYAVQYQMRVNPQALTQTAPFPWGGSKHSETILSSCLAIAELSVDSGGNGRWAQDFMQRLAASISMDGQDSVPDNIGYMGDPSTFQRDGRRRCRDGFYATYNNVQY